MRGQRERVIAAPYAGTDDAKLDLPLSHGEASSPGIAPAALPRICATAVCNPWATAASAITLAPPKICRRQLGCHDAVDPTRLAGSSRASRKRSTWRSRGAKAEAPAHAWPATHHAGDQRGEHINRRRKLCVVLHDDALRRAVE